MASKRLIREAIQRGLEAYVLELSELDQRRKELKAKIDELEQEFEPNGHTSSRKDKRGKKLPFSQSDIRALMEKTENLDFSSKGTAEAARAIYKAAGIDLHAALAYQIAVNRGLKMNSKDRPADIFASYLRRSNDFEKIKAGVFRLKGIAQ